MNAVPQLVERGGQSVDYEASLKFTRPIAGRASQAPTASRVSNGDVRVLALDVGAIDDRFAVLRRDQSGGEGVHGVVARERWEEDRLPGQVFQTSSISRRAMLNRPGSIGGGRSRVNQSAASISPSCGTISPRTQSQWNATMREWGNGQGWLEK